MNPVVSTVLLLLCSNIFMTFAWYGHLKQLNNKIWIIAALVSWGIALFESIESTDHSAITGIPLMELTSLLRRAGLELP